MFASTLARLGHTPNIASLFVQTSKQTHSAVNQRPSLAIITGATGKRGYAKKFASLYRTLQKELEPVSMANENQQKSQMLPSEQNYVYVRSVADDDGLKINFKYKFSENSEKEFTFNRMKSDLLRSVFARMEQNIANKLFGKKENKKKAKNMPTTDVTSEAVDSKITITLELKHNDQMVDLDTINALAWTDGANLVINGINYVVKLNPPNVKSLSLPKMIMAGFAVYPAVDIEFASVEDCQFTWFKKRLPFEKKKRSKSQGSSDGLEVNGDTDNHIPVGFGGWIKAHDGFAYEVLNEDVGRHLKLICVPRNSDVIGREVEIDSKHPIQSGPGRCPFEDRILFTTELSPVGSFRVVTYNILANLYADQEYTRDVLYPYCAPYALTFDYRKPLLLKEINGYNCDILCLQEVDTSAFANDLQPILSKSSDMTGIFARKGGQVAEGCAVFFRRTKFRSLWSEQVTIAEVLLKNPKFAPFLSKLQTNETLITSNYGPMVSFTAGTSRGCGTTWKVAVGVQHTFVLSS